MVKLGAHFATPFEPDWPTLRARLHRARFEAAKIMIPAGFLWNVSHVRDLIADGMKEIILRTEDDDYTPQTLRQDFVERGFYEVVRDNPDVQFILEVGNEQDRARDSEGRPNPMDPWVGRFWLLQTRKELSYISSPNLKWVASLPTSFEQVKNVYMTKNQEGSIAELYDGIAAHAYGDFYVQPNSHYDWDRILDFLLVTTQLPVYITEFGINHSPMDKREKGSRYLDWLSTLNADRIKSAYVFWVGDGERYPQYQVNDEMADVLSKRTGIDPKDPKEQPKMTQKQALEYLQRAVQRFHPDFEPVEIVED